MAAAAGQGRYLGLSRGRLAMLGLAAAYIVSPIDVVPEGLLLVLGLVDDLAVAAWLTTQLLVETDRYLAWERSESRPRSQA